MRIFNLFLLTALFSSCRQQPEQFQETGILVLTNARNHTSFDYFIPCDINDSVSLSTNIHCIKAHLARRVDPNGFQYQLTNTSWISSPDSFYIKNMHQPWCYISPVELTLEKREHSSKEDEIEKVSTLKIAGNIYINQFYTGHYEIRHIKQIILAQY